MTCEVSVEIDEITGESNEPTVTYDMSFLNRQIKFLRWVHLACFVFLYIGNYLENKKVSNHFSQILNLVSLCLYFLVIFSNIQSIFDL